MKQIALATVVFLPVFAGIAQVSSPTTSPQPSPASAQAQAINLTLLPYWNKKLTGGYDAMNELLAVIDKYTRPDGSLSIDEFPEIYAGTKLVMPLKEAVLTLGLDKQPTPSKTSISFPGVPFFYRIFTNPDRSSPFNLIYLVTDAADRLVAVQLVDEAPKDFDPQILDLRQSDQKTYNFVNNRKRAVKTLSISVGVRDGKLGKAKDITIYEGNLETAKKSAATMAQSQARMLETNASSIESTKKKIEKFEALNADLKKQIEEDANNLASITDEVEITNLKRGIKQNERQIASCEQALVGMRKSLAIQEANYAKQTEVAAQATPSPTDRWFVSQATLCVKTVLEERRKPPYRVLEVVEWYVPRRIANFINYCLKLHLDGTPRQVGAR